MQTFTSYAKIGFYSSIALLSGYTLWKASSKYTLNPNDAKFHLVYPCKPGSIDVVEKFRCVYDDKINKHILDWQYENGNRKLSIKYDYTNDTVEIKTYHLNGRLSNNFIIEDKHDIILDDISDDLELSDPDHPFSDPVDEHPYFES